MRITESALRRIIREQIESAGEMPDPRAAKRGVGTKLVVYTENPERAEFITVTGPKGTEHTYFYGLAGESTVHEIIHQLGIDWTPHLYDMIEEVLRQAMAAQRNAEAATFAVTFELGEDLDARWELIHRAA